MATNSERSFNEFLARVLRTKNPRWRALLTAEQHRTVKGGGMPDLIVRNPGGSPVVVETEYVPARTVEKEDGEQTSRMAMAIIANALTFQTMLAGVYDIRTLDDLRSSGALPKAPVVREWERILEINYWPIFHVAREVLVPIPDGVASRLLDTLAVVSSELEAHGVTQSHDIYGRTFQRLISDRKFLATFYTLPASATLLAELAVDLIDADWRDVLVDLLGLPSSALAQLAVLRTQWCSEPTVHGGKATRPAPNITTALES